MQQADLMVCLKKLIDREPILPQLSRQSFKSVMHGLWQNVAYMDDIEYVQLCWKSGISGRMLIRRAGQIQRQPKQSGLWQQKIWKPHALVLLYILQMTKEI